MSQDSFIHRLYAHIQSHYNLENEELTVVFPNKRAAFYLRSEFKRNCTGTIWLPQMLSIQEAVVQWSGITLVDNINLLFELIDIDAHLHQNQVHDSSLNIFGSQAAQMAKDFDEIDQYDINAHHVFNYITENKRLEFWNFDESKSKEKELKYLQFFTRLNDYYLQLRERLLSKGQGYYGLITRYLAHLSENELVERTGRGKVVFAGFNALTTTEQRIIETLVKHGKAEVVFDYDRYYIDDAQNEAGTFARRYLDTHPEWMKNGITDMLGHEEKQIHIISVSGNALQSKALQENLQSSPDQPPAIILADENLLIPVLNAIPDTEAFKNIRVSMGYPVKRTQIHQLVNIYFSLRRRNKITRKIIRNGATHEVEGWYIWPILQVMDMELTRTIFSKKEIASFSQWRLENVKNGKFILEESDLDAMTETKDIQLFLKALLQNPQGQEPQSQLEGINRLLRFVAKQLQAKNDERGILFLLNQVSEVGKIISRISQVIEHHADYIHDLSSIEILYKLLSSGASIKLNSSSTEGLQIMGLLETRNIDISRLHVLGVNEGILPADKSQGSFIPHFIRKECGLPSYAEKQAVFAYHFYHLLQNGEDIYLYYNDLGESSGGEASRYILQIRHELARHPNIHIVEEAFSGDTQTTIETLALTAPKGRAIERLRHILQKDGLSPSALSTYLGCTLKYYLKYIEQIKDNSTEEDIGANVVGTITHDALELLFAPYLPHDGKKQIIDKELFDNVIQPQWESKLNQSIEKNMPCGFPDVGYNYLNKIIIRQQLKNYLQYTSRQVASGQLVILETEGDLKAWFATPFGECLTKGRTDRIDQWGEMIRVIDYKTGYVDSHDLQVPVRHHDDSNLDYLKTIPDKALQLLLYKYMYLKEHPETAASQVEATIHGLRYGNTIEFGLTHTPPKKDDEQAFLEDDTFIPDMEALLRALVAEMLDAETPFIQTDDKKRCKNCDFNLICKRDEK